MTQRSSTALPFKLKSQPAGTQKAYSEFVKTYGKSEGERVFIAYAEEHGKGNTLRQKCNSVFRKGSHIAS